MVLILRRMTLSLCTIFLVCSFSFFLIHFVPGDPVDLILGAQVNALDRMHLRKELGLDQNIGKQYFAFFNSLLQGELGMSLHSRRPVIDELLQALPVTFGLAFVALCLSTVFGLCLSLLCVFKRGYIDRFFSILSLVFMSLPAFFLAPLLIWFFSIKLSWLPVSESGEGIGLGGWKHFILPALSLAFPLGAVLLKMSRAALFEVMNKDYIQTAVAKGVSPFWIYFKHGLRNALIPIITIVGLQSGAVLTGTVIVETIFDWPGLGLLLLESIQRRDYPVVQGTILLIAVIYVLSNLMTDLVYVYFNPKIRSL